MHVFPCVFSKRGCAPGTLCCSVQVEAALRMRSEEGAASTPVRALCPPRSPASVYGALPDVRMRALDDARIP